MNRERVQSLPGCLRRRSFAARTLNVSCRQRVNNGGDGRCAPRKHSQCWFVRYSLRIGNGGDLDDHLLVFPGGLVVMA